MYRCPKCGHNMQWRAPEVYGTGNYWICSQCGNWQQNYTTNKIEREDANEGQKICSQSSSRTE